MLERESARVLDLLAADLHHRAVSEHDLEPAHIVARDAVLQRAHAAGVRADVAADARGLFAGIGRVEQPARFDIGLQILQKHAGLDRDGHRVLVELEHAVHAGKVEDDAALERHGRADKIRPRAARRDGNAVLMRIAQKIAHLFGGQGKGERLGAAVDAAERVALIVCGNVRAGEQTAFVRNDTPQCGKIKCHNKFLPERRTAARAPCVAGARRRSDGVY